MSSKTPVSTEPAAVVKPVYHRARSAYNIFCSRTLPVMS